MLAKMTNVCTKHPLEEHLSHIRDNTGPVAQKKGRTYILRTRQLLGATDEGRGSSLARMISRNYIL